MNLLRWFAFVLLAMAIGALPAWAAKEAAHADAKAKDHDHGKAGGAHKDDAHSDAEHSEAEAGDAASSAAAHDDGSGPNPLVIDPDLAIYSLVVFLLLLLVLTKFAWKPIMQGLDAREHSIVNHIESAKQSHEDAKRLLAEYEEKLAGAQDQIRHLLDEARKNADVASAEVMAQAKANAQQELARAKHEIETATDVALKTLAEHQANQAVALASKILGKELHPQEHQRLIEEAVSKFPNIDSVNN